MKALKNLFLLIVLPFAAHSQQGTVDTSYASMLSHYQNGDHRKSTVLFLMNAAVKKQDMQTATNLHNEYMNDVDNPFVRSNLNIIINTTQKPSDLGFKWLTKNKSKIDSLYHDNDLAESSIVSCMQNAIVSVGLLHIDVNRDPDWSKIKETLSKIDDSLSDRGSLFIKVNYFAAKNNWEKWAKAQLDYYDKYYKHFDHDERFWVNNVLFEMFNRCFNKTTLTRAASWSFQDNNNVDSGADPGSMDTYANLLYKSGQKEKAIEWEMKAVEKEKKDASKVEGQKVDPEFEQNLKKMEANEPTWPIN